MKMAYQQQWRGQRAPRPRAFAAGYLILVGVAAVILYSLMYHWLLELHLKGTAKDMLTAQKQHSHSPERQERTEEERAREITVLKAEEERNSIASTRPPGNAKNINVAPQTTGTGSGKQDAETPTKPKEAKEHEHDVDCPCPMTLVTRIGARGQAARSAQQAAGRGRGETKGKTTKGEEGTGISISGDRGGGGDTAMYRCLSFLSNYSYVTKVTAMLATARFGRTVKMKLSYDVPPPAKCQWPIEALIKLPQSLFPLEPYSEYVAFEIDQLLEMNYVPPTTWLFVPIADIEGAALRSLNDLSEREADATIHGGGGDDGDDEGGDKKSVMQTYGDTGFGGKAAKTQRAEEEAVGTLITHRHDYSRWVSREVFLYAINHGLLVPRPDDGRLSIGCSVQLWIRGTRTALGTPLKYSEDEAVAKLALEHQVDPTTGRRVVRPVQETPAVSDSEHEEGIVPYPIYQRLYLSDVYLFDGLIANDDRGPIKNTNVFRLKGADVKLLLQSQLPQPSIQPQLVDGTDQKGKDKGKGPSRYQYINIDQGKSLYLEHIPKTSPFGSVADEEQQGGKTRSKDVCVFRKNVYNILRGLSTAASVARGGKNRDREAMDAERGDEDLLSLQGGLMDLFIGQGLIPLPILRHIGARRLGWLQRRLDRLVDHMTHCVSEFGLDAVLLEEHNKY